jgi:SAM-dependent methyltransferase
MSDQADSVPSEPNQENHATTVHIDRPVSGFFSSPLVSFQGWISTHSGFLSRIRLRNDRGVELPLTIMDRPDVQAAFPELATCGFIGKLDLRTAAEGPWYLEFGADAFTSRVELPVRATTEALAVFRSTKTRKLERIRPLLRCPHCYTRLFDDNDGLICEEGHVYRQDRDAYILLDAMLSSAVGADDTDNISAHGYDSTLLQLIQESVGPILDVGAGLRPEYREDVVNLEIVAYPTTDVVGASEHLPFADESFDLVISSAVLEHVRDPFRSANELMRVLKPGGKIFAAVPFLQPYHAYPHHYYNMTSEGLRNLFAPLEVIELNVPLSGSPIFALTWILQLWKRSLPAEVAAVFGRMTVDELAVDPLSVINAPFVRELGPEANRDLAALNVLVGQKQTPP